MLEAAAREENRQVCRHVGVRIAHVAAVEHHRSVQKRLVSFVTSPSARRTALRQKLHVLTVDPLQLGHLLAALAVVREVVVAISDRFSPDDDRGELTESSIRVMFRVASVSKARRAMWYISRVFSMYSRGSF